MKEAFANSRTKGMVTAAFRFFKEEHRDDIYDAALLKVPVAERARIEAALTAPRRTKGFLEERKKARLDAESWTTLLAHRQRVTGEATAEERATYRRRLREDENRLRRKFPEWYRAKTNKEEGWRSKGAERFEHWCRESSWTMCKQCRRMEPRSLRQVDIAGQRGRQTNTVEHCKHCKNGTGYPTVQIEDIPEVLRGLSEKSLWALGLLDIFSGQAVWAPHGYRVHTDMTRFWWRPQTVEDQILELLETGAREDARRAEEAYDYLMQAGDSSYRQFYDYHRKFLNKNQELLTGEPKEDGRVLQLPRQCIEEVGIECALWPHLYPRTNMCETHVRASHYTRVGKPTQTVLDKSFARARDRQLRERREAAIAHEASSDSSITSESKDEDAEDGADGDFARGRQNSAKSSYLAKVLGPVAEYGANYELFQFVYDL